MSRGWVWVEAALLLQGLLLAVLGQVRQQIRTDECPIILSNKGLYILQIHYPRCARPVPPSEPGLECGWGCRFKSRGGFETEEAGDWLVLGQNRTYISVATNPFFRLTSSSPF